MFAPGTVSKSLAPALRLGWIASPPTLTQPLARAKQLSDHGSPGLDQLALALFIETGRYDRHLRQMRAECPALADEPSRHDYECRRQTRRYAVRPGHSPFLDSRAPPRPLPPRPGTPNVVSQVWLTLTPACGAGRQDLPDPPAIGAHLQASQSGCSVAGDLTQPESDQHKSAR